jgi:CheY-like chemotaxis protein
MSIHAAPPPGVTDSADLFDFSRSRRLAATASHLPYRPAVEDAMTTPTATVQARPAPHSIRTALVVGHEGDERVMGAIAQAGNYDMVVVEPPQHAYSQIKRVAPDMIVVCLSMDDPEGFQVMSMLQLDRDTAKIPMIMCLVQPVAPHPDV